MRLQCLLRCVGAYERVVSGKVLASIFYAHSPGVLLFGVLCVCFAVVFGGVLFRLTLIECYIQVILSRTEPSMGPNGMWLYVWCGVVYFVVVLCSVDMG